MTVTKITKGALLVMAGLACGLTVMTFAPSGCRSGDTDIRERDTVKTVIIDTVTAVRPVADATLVIDTLTCRLPVVNHDAVTKHTADSTLRAGTSLLTRDSTIRLYGTGAGGEPRQCRDSATVEIPITQKHYVDTMYEAWVSGFAQQLDSIRVYPRTEVVKITEYKSPNRWHIGISAGYACTGRGLAPYIGVGITYSIFSWK